MPRFLPYPGRTHYRGIDFQKGTPVSGLFLPAKSRRNTAVCLDTKGLTLNSSDPSVATVEYSEKPPVKNRFRLDITGRKPGIATISTQPGHALLRVVVGGPIPLRIAFRAIKGDGWSTASSLKSVNEYINRARVLLKYQGNIVPQLHGPPKAVSMPDLPKKIAKHGDIKAIRDERAADVAADVTVFFVPDYVNPKAKKKTQRGLSHREIVLIESATSAKDGKNTKIFTHELGHFMGLAHTSQSLLTPASPFRNLMDVDKPHPTYTKLTTAQIIHIRNRSNWKNSEEFHCQW